MFVLCLAFIGIEWLGNISYLSDIFLSGSLTSKSFYFTTVLCKLEELNYVNCMVALRLTKQIINCWSGSITNVK